jgi:hypothetical protein
MWTYSGSIDTGQLDPTGQFAFIPPGVVHWEPSSLGFAAPTWFTSRSRGIVFKRVTGTADGSAGVSGFLVGAIFPKTWDIPETYRDSFLPWFSTYTLKLSIQDSASHKMGTFLFPGFLYGDQGTDSSARITGYFGTYPPLTPPFQALLQPVQLPKIAPTVRSLTLGNFAYTVTVNPFRYSQDPSPTPADYVPSTPESVQVTVTPLNEPVAATPEPSAILLVLTGLAGLMPLVRRRMRY